MFSRDDFGRGRAHPLLWVFGPLVLGALIITGLGIAARATQGFPNIELAAEIEDAAAAGDPLLAETTPFAWDRVCIAPQSATPDDVDELLELEWGVAGGDPLKEGRPLLVFVDGGKVVTHFWMRRGVLDDPPPEGVCYGPDDESTRL